MGAASCFTGTEHCHVIRGVTGQLTGSLDDAWIMTLGEHDSTTDCGRTGIESIEKIQSSSSAGYCTATVRTDLREGLTGRESASFGLRESKQE
jgi:hypothetical protein